MTDYITDGSIQIDLQIDWNSIHQKNIIASQSVTIGGRVTQYIWGSFNDFSFPLDCVPSSDAMQMNKWWETNTNLILYFDQNSYDVQIMNKPFNSFSRPYTDQLQGTLNVEKI